jgi:hypothetical protein
MTFFRLYGSVNNFSFLSSLSTLPPASPGEAFIRLSVGLVKILCNVLSEAMHDADFIGLLTQAKESKGLSWSWMGSDQHLSLNSIAETIIYVCDDLLRLAFNLGSDVFMNEKTSIPSHRF